MKNFVVVSLFLIIGLSCLPYFKVADDILIAETNAQIAPLLEQAQKEREQTAFILSQPGVNTHFKDWRDNRRTFYQRASDGAAFLFGFVLCALVAAGFFIVRRALPVVATQLDQICRQQEDTLNADYLQEQQARRVVVELVHKRRKAA